MGLFRRRSTGSARAVGSHRHEISIDSGRNETTNNLNASQSIEATHSTIDWSYEIDNFIANDLEAGYNNFNAVTSSPFNSNGLMDVSDGEISQRAMDFSEHEDSRMSLDASLVPINRVKADLRELLYACEAIQGASTSNSTTNEGRDFLKEFHMRTKLREVAKERRKKDLAELPILDCHTLSLDYLRDFVSERHSKVNMLFNFRYDRKKFILIEDLYYNWLEISTAGFLTDTQLLHVARCIEQQRNVEARGTLDDELHCIVIPYMLVEVFRVHHGFTTGQALMQISSQVEKAELFGMNASF
jgi:hypothetical protein